MTPERPIAVVTRLASSTFGTFRGRAAVDNGVSRTQLATLLAHGAIERVFPDTYRLIAAPRSHEQLVCAALLWAGDDSAAAVCSLRSCTRRRRTRATARDRRCPSTPARDEERRRSAHPRPAVLDDPTGAGHPGGRRRSVPPRARERARRRGARDRVRRRSAPAPHVRTRACARTSTGTAAEGDQALPRCADFSINSIRSTRHARRSR